MKAGESEASIQASTVSLLRLSGYIVMETGKDRSGLQGLLARSLRPHLKCDEKALFSIIGNCLRSWASNDAGLPDLLVTHPGWPVFWMPIEMKKPGGKVRTAQEKLFKDGRSIICYSAKDALEAVIEFEEDQGLSRLESHAKLGKLVAQL